VTGAGVRSRAWLTLAVLCAAQFLVVLDITVVNVALPAIREDLDPAPGRLHWAVTAYAVAFGGLLLLAGRLADLRGARRAFLAGIGIFGACSLACGLATGAEVLAVARALQGLGAALISPAALALLVRAFAEGRPRTMALGAWGSAGALAAASGVLLGGALVELLDWRWIFLVNVPVALAALCLGPAVLSRDPAPRRGALDPVAALLATGAVMALVGGLSEAAVAGWASARALAPLAGAAALAVLLWRRERRAAEPLVPRDVLGSPAVLAANLAGFLHGAMMLGAFLLLSLQMQDLLGLSPLAAGAGLLATRATSVLWAQAGARLAHAVGARAVMALGMAGMTAALALLARVGPGGSYAADLLPALLVLGAAIPLLFLTINMTALEGAPAHRAGLASGLLNTSQWVGGALGAAAAAALAGGAVASPDALAGGLRTGFLVLVGLGFAGTALALALLRVPASAAPAAGRA
jgi:EmrB/QacA subfamily drug resistance transporter